MTVPPRGVIFVVPQEKGTTGLKPTPRLPWAGPCELALIEFPFPHEQEMSTLVQSLSCVSNGSLAPLIPVRESITVRLRFVSEMVGAIETEPTPLADHGEGPDTVTLSGAPL